jgi:DNA polymerase I
MVPVEQLIERNRVSKPLEGYTNQTRNVAALQRARDQGISVHPGQDIEYVVVDDDKATRDRVVLAHEEPRGYDASYYEDQLIRAAESILSPLKWNQAEIRQHLSSMEDTVLSAFSTNG